jgi:threonine/homoserine/homoserine lactone efflux protein
MAVSFVYLLLATYGVAHFLEGSGIQLMLWVLSSYLLIHMGLNSLHAKKTKLSLAHAKGHKLKLLDADFFKGFVICLFNPLAIVGAFVIVGGLYASHTGGASPLSFTLSVLAGDFLSAILIAGVTF